MSHRQSASRHAMVSRSREVLDLNDDLLAEILIRLPTLSDLGQACTVCKAFHRVITGQSFLRRLHALRPPSLLGFRTFTGKFQPVEPPNPHTAAACALAGAADFRFLFLPNAGYWVVRDFCAGRFVLDYDEHGDGIFNKIVVCDPLFQRYALLPPIPQDLASAVLEPYTMNGESSRRCEVFLAPYGEEEEASMGTPESFRMIWMARCPTKLVTFIFSSSNWQWRANASPNWCDLNHTIRSRAPDLDRRSYAHGCFYWLLNSNTLVELDTSSMEFSSVSRLPYVHGNWYGKLAIVELGKSRYGMFMFRYLNYRSTVLQLFGADRQNRVGGTTEWLLENEVSLPSMGKYRILGDADGKLILQTQSSNGEAKFSCISLDFKTLHPQRVRGMLRGGYSLPFLYTGYPPSLTLPTI